ncbi:hypothetical protein ACLQ2R_32175 [Streptosporangium sp. DT93]|uniref:hypothetical protein n=1 Tax=Streptosporangium sp. DT93 TaxID=3393428 RepID=UPI003CF02281
MPVLMIRYQVADEGAEEVADAVRATFAEVGERRPDGIRYACLRLAGGTEFVALLELDEGVENPLPGMEAARRLRAAVTRWAVEPGPVPRPVEVLGSYRVLG